MSEGTFDEKFGELSQLLRPVDLRLLPGNPLVSVLLLNYNYARFIGQAIESVLQQTYRNFEIVVCDDGSTDNSCEIVEAYARRDHRVRLLRKSNGGVITAVNASYPESKGQIICLLDADDRYLPRKLEMVVDAFRMHPGSGFLSHRIARVDSQGRQNGILPLLWEPPTGWYGPSVVRTGDLPPGLVPTVGLCFRREIGNLILPLPEELKNLGGWDHAIRCVASLATRLVGIPAVLAEYRLHGNNAMNSQRMDCEVLNWMQDIHKACWRMQRSYLERIDPRLAEMLPSPGRQMGFQIRAYLSARLGNSGGTLSAYRDLLRTKSFPSYPAGVRWFWRSSILLPVPVFRKVVDALWGQSYRSPLKRSLFQALRLARRGKTFDPKLA